MASFNGKTRFGHSSTEVSVEGDDKTVIIAIATVAVAVGVITATKNPQAAVVSSKFTYGLLGLLL